MGFIRGKIYAYWRPAVVGLTPILLLPLLLLHGRHSEARCGYVVLITAIFWLTEALPVAVTALIPVITFPILGVMSAKEVSRSYMTDANMAMLGAVAFSVAIEDSQLHRRTALFILKHAGKRPKILLVVFMAAAAFLSMWISSGAATAVMIPFMDSVLEHLDEKWKPPKNMVIPKIIITDIEEDREILWVETNLGFENDFEVDLKEEPSQELASNSRRKPSRANLQPDITALDTVKFRKCLFLSVAYSAVIGGSATTISSPPNLQLLHILNTDFKETDLNFGTWLAFGFPTMVFCLFGSWFWLFYHYFGFRRADDEKVLEQVRRKDIAFKKIMGSKLKALEPISYYERVVLILAAILICFWLILNPLMFWVLNDILENLYAAPLSLSDSASVMLVVLLLFVIKAKEGEGRPGNYSDRPPNNDDQNIDWSSGTCLQWRSVEQRIPWGVLLLTGAGSALADGSISSNLSVWLGNSLQELKNLNSTALLLTLAVVATSITNIMSNYATAAILLPAIEDLSLQSCCNPLYLMIPTTLCCAYAFVLPVATTPNALVHHTAKLTTTDMIKAGFATNILCIVTVAIMINTLGVSLFSLKEVPHWVNSTSPEAYFNCSRER